MSDLISAATPSEQVADLCLLALQKNALRRVVFSKPHDRTLQRMVLTPSPSGNRPALQAEYFHKDNKATHRNIPLSDAPRDALIALTEEFSQINLLCVGGECEYRASSSGKRILLGGDKLRKYLESMVDVPLTILAESHRKNAKKSHILDGSEPFLRLLGISDEHGRVYDRRQAKFRQINRFLELVRDVEDRLPTDEIRICDLCCGKSYLSFAVYHYFANVKKYRVTMTGIDLKPDVIETCSRAARELGFDGLSFVCGDIRAYETDVRPQLVISLHACDIATDIVLEKAMAWQTDVILSTPCCHHELNHTIDCPELSFITDYSMLRQKLCDAATDALRLCHLEAEGYSTAAIELIDPDETPKNIMLRAIRKKNFSKESAQAKKARACYLAAKEFLCGTDTDTLHV